MKILFTLITLIITVINTEDIIYMKYFILNNNPLIWLFLFPFYHMKKQD